MGRYYEEFEPGQRYETPRRTVIEADISQFADAADKDDVGGLDVAMGQPAIVHVVEGIGQVHAGIPAKHQVQAAVAFHVRAQGPRHV